MLPGHFWVDGNDAGARLHAVGPDGLLYKARPVELVIPCSATRPSQGGCSLPARVTRKTVKPHLFNEMLPRGHTTSARRGAVVRLTSSHVLPRSHRAHGGPGEMPPGGGAERIRSYSDGPREGCRWGACSMWRGVALDGVA